MVITLISLMIFSIKANKTVIIITMVMVMSNVQALEKADIQFVQHSYPDENHSLGGVSRFFQDIIIVMILS